MKKWGRGFQKSSLSEIMTNTTTATLLERYKQMKYLYFAMTKHKKVSLIKCLWLSSVIPGFGSPGGTCDHGTGTTGKCSRHLSPGCDALPISLLLGQKCRWDYLMSSFIHPCVIVNSLEFLSSEENNNVLFSTQIEELSSKIVHMTSEAIWQIYVRNKPH